jgi:hypothetical protein
MAQRASEEEAVASGIIGVGQRPSLLGSCNKPSVGSVSARFRTHNGRKLQASVFAVAEMSLGGFPARRGSDGPLLPLSLR